MRVLRNIGKVGVLLMVLKSFFSESTDSVFYGPIDKFEVLNGGKGYSNGTTNNFTTGAGTTALNEPLFKE